MITTEMVLRKIIEDRRSFETPPEARDRLAASAPPDIAEALRALTFPEPRRGQPPRSVSGERRRPWNLGVAPAVRVRVEAEAIRRGVSASSLIEEWALTLPQL